MRVSRYQKAHFAIFWIFWSKMKITQVDAPTIWMDCHPIQTNWCPHLCHPHHFYAGCPSLHNPPKLSWLGTRTKYAGLHTWWLDYTCTSMWIILIFKVARCKMSLPMTELTYYLQICTIANIYTGPMYTGLSVFCTQKTCLLSSSSPVYHYTYCALVSFWKFLHSF